MNCARTVSRRLSSMAIVCAASFSLSAFAQIIPAPPKAAADTFLPDPKAPYLDYSKDWPTRWTPPDSTSRGVIVPLTLSASTMSVHFLSGREPKSETDESDFTALASLFPQPEQSRLAWQLEGYNATPVESRRNKPRFLRTGEPDASLVFRFVSGTLSLMEREPTVSLERTTFALYEPIGTAATHVVVLLPGMFGTPEEILEPLIQHFRRSGFPVLRMFSHPSRFTEELSLSINPADAEDLKTHAVQIAATVNSRLAECAYSVDAALDYILHERPDLKSLPVIAFGGSGGAIAIPTVCALKPARWAGAIMVGTAADFWLVNQRSNYQNLIKALRVKWTTEPTQNQRNDLDCLYLQHATLDPFHTARALAGIPVFMIHGENDQAVPAALGDLLWERMQPRDNQSRKISTPLTHEALFGTLPARFDELTDWIKPRK